jgi:hypothetical protein
LGEDKAGKLLGKLMEGVLKATEEGGCGKKDLGWRKNANRCICLDSPMSITNENVLQEIAKELHDEASCRMRVQTCQAPSTADITNTAKNPSTSIHQDWGKNTNSLSRLLAHWSLEWEGMESPVHKLIRQMP